MDKELKAINIPIEEFLKCFFNVTDILNIRVFEDKKTGVFKGQKLSVEAGKFETIRKTLEEHNKRDRGVFFVVNTGGNTDSEIQRINAQFTEMDEGSFEEQWAKVKAFKLEPSLVVKTRKSLHCYWLVKSASVDKFRTVQKGLVSQFNGDKMCVNESRLLRLPGFNHCKEEHIKVEIVKYNPELRYTQAELISALPTVESPDTENKITTLSKRSGLSLMGRCEFIKHCNENADKLSESDWYAMITNLAGFDGGTSLIHELSSKYKGYNKADTDNKILHFLESKTAPMTCKAIAEKGFKCPMLKKGCCGCKSPAGLAYKPYNAEEIKALLLNETASFDVVDNMAKASTFIKKNMYNIDKMIAEPMIESYLAQHFRFKADNAKRLVALYRETAKEHAKKREKNIEAVSTMGEWYEETEKGMRFMPGVLSRVLSEKEKVFYAAEKYFAYRNGVYRPITEIAIKNTVQKHLNERYAVMSQISDTSNQWTMRIEKKVSELDSNAFIINCKNGLYNVLDDSFKEHTHEYMTTVQINPSYDPSAKCEAFMKYLSESLEPEEVNLVQEILGYLLIPISNAQKCFVFTGVAHAGKSVLLSVISDILLGTEQVSHIMWQQLGDRFKTAELFGKLANTFADLPTENIDSNSMFKAITGQDYITAEEKNKKPFSFRPYARLVFSCNEVPMNYSDRSEGFYRRLIIIPFEKAVPVEKRDVNLMDKLRVESDGILNFAIVGLKRLIQNSYVFTETTKTQQTLEQYKKDSNSVLQFVDELCEMKEGVQVGAQDLFDRYVQYCKDSEYKPLGKKKFNAELKNLPPCYKWKDGLSRRMLWKNIKLIN